MCVWATCTCEVVDSTDQLAVGAKCTYVPNPNKGRTDSYPTTEINIRSLEGTTVITNWDLPFVTFPNKKRQEVAKIAEIFLTPINIGQPEMLLFL